VKAARHAPAVTSLPLAPQDEVAHRVRRYALTMSIRIACFALMVLVQPYGWYTWVFAIAAAVLPYIAVVFANAGSDSTETRAESPMQQLESSSPEPAVPPAEPRIVTIRETPEERS